jgi:hypothetical protein
LIFEGLIDHETKVLELVPVPSLELVELFVVFLLPCFEHHRNRLEEKWMFVELVD